MKHKNLCIHELEEGQCGLCKPPPLGIHEIVFTTKGGQVFHNWSDCAYLLAGQSLAETRGQNNHPIVPTKWSSVYYSYGACEWCAARHHLRDTKLMTCEVLISGKWEKASYLRERFLDHGAKEHQVMLDMTNTIHLVTGEKIRF